MFYLHALKQAYSENVKTQDSTRQFSITAHESKQWTITYFSAEEIAQWAKALATKPSEFDALDSHGGRRKPIPVSCPLTSTHSMTCTCPHINIHTYKIINHLKNYVIFLVNKICCFGGGQCPPCSCYTYTPVIKPFHSNCFLNKTAQLRRN